MQIKQAEKSISRSPFPSTHWSMLRQSSDPALDSEARRRGLQTLARTYWKPIYAYFRLRWRESREQAEDLTQDFFVWLMEGPFLDRAEPGHGRFRNFVRAHLDNFMRNRIRTRGRQCRGGDRKVVYLEFGDDPDAYLADLKQVSVDEILDRQWRLTMLEHAIERLQTSLAEQGKDIMYEVFCRYDLSESAEEGPTYSALAHELDLSVPQVRDYLFHMRRRLYATLKEVVAESVDSSEALEAELETFFSEVHV